MAAYRLMQPVEQVGAWLFRVARNRIIDLFRKKKFAARKSDAMTNDAEPLLLDDLLPSPDAGPEALERFRYIRVSALGNDGQGAGKLDLRPLWECLELLPRRPDPLNRPRRNHRLYVVKYDNTCQACKCRNWLYR